MTVNTGVELHYKFYLCVALPFRQKKGNNDLEIRLAHWSTAVAKNSPDDLHRRKGRQDWPFYIQPHFLHLVLLAAIKKFFSPKYLIHELIHEG